MTESRALDTQVSGTHYKKYAIQPIEFSMANGLNCCQFNAIKYILRHKDKDGKKDLEKAIHMIQILMEMEYPDG